MQIFMSRRYQNFKTNPTWLPNLPDIHVLGLSLQIRWHAALAKLSHVCARNPAASNWVPKWCNCGVVAAYMASFE
eukprot:3287483-Amphidinium_carterae.1